MVIQTTSIVTETIKPPERTPLREEMRPARGLLVGLALSAIIWLSFTIAWLML